MNSLGVIITIIFVVIWVVRGIATVMGSNPDSQAGANDNSSGQPGDLDRRIAAQRARRARLAEQQRAQAQALVDRREGVAQKDLSQMSMAERIELARERARSGQTHRQRQQAQQAEAGMQEAMREKQAVEARQRQEAVRRQQAQEQAQRRRAEQERQQRAAARKQAQEEQARQEQLERRQRRAQRQARQQRKAAQASAASQQPTASRKQRRQTRKQGADQSQGLGDRGQRVSSNAAKKNGKLTIGPLDQQSLRRAFVMKELLDKPVALRGEQDGLLS